MAEISVVGLGKLGAPLAAVLSSKGHKVIGVDKNSRVVDLINAGVSPYEEPGLKQLLVEFPFSAAHYYDKAVLNTDVSFIIVPTPSEANGAFSNRYVLDSVRSIGQCLLAKDSWHLVVVCSTVMPGSCVGEISAVLEESSARQVGRDVGLCYSPEFIALGSVIENMLHPDMSLVGESDRVSGDCLEKILKSISDAPCMRMGLTDAEIAKISVNTYITMKISFANQIAELCEKIPYTNAMTVLDAVGMDTRIGQKYLFPGSAYGGPCFPRDTKAFSALGKQHGVSCDLAVATERINDRQVERLVEIAKNSGCTRIGVLGLTYKVGTPVMEESPGLLLARRLHSEGFRVKAYDPAAYKHVADEPFETTIGPGPILDGTEIIFLMTPWPDFKKLFPAAWERYPLIKVVDCWGIVESGPWDETNIIRIGKGCFQ